MVAVYPWFHTSLYKPAGPHSIGPSMLEDDSYEVEAILQVNKHEKKAIVRYMDYNSYYNQ